MSISDPNHDRLESQSIGSDLCLSCGLCCTGLLHDRAVLLPTEFILADEIGLTILALDSHETPTFRLPCPCFQQGRCATYTKRPEACGRYRCNLLRGVEAQEMDQETAREPIEQAKRLIAEIETLIGDTIEGETVWQRAARFAKHRGLRLHTSEFTQAFPQLQLKISTLYILCDRHFEPVNSK